MLGTCGMQYVVEADGSVYPCDFYMLDQYKLGNLNTDTLAQIDARRKEIGFIEQSCAVDEKCKICKWYQLCRGGCRRDRDYYQDGIGRNYYCAAYERFFEYAWPKLGEVYEEVIVQWTSKQGHRWRWARQLVVFSANNCLLPSRKPLPTRIWWGVYRLDVSQSSQFIRLPIR